MLPPLPRDKLLVFPPRLLVETRKLRVDGETQTEAPILTVINEDDAELGQLGPSQGSQGSLLTPVPSLALPIGEHVNAATKNRITSGMYIDLLTLKHDFEQRTVIIIVQR